jgi:hypothetical protein
MPHGVGMTHFLFGLAVGFFLAFPFSWAVNAIWPPEDHTP